LKGTTRKQFKKLSKVVRM